MKSPDETLAEQIIAELKKEEIIDTTKIDSYKAKLSNGSISAEDWRLLCELADRGKEKANG